MEGLLAILGWILFGLVVGALARLIIPGRQAIGLPMTIALGVAGSFAGGLISALVTDGTLAFQPSDFLWALVGATLLLGGYVYMNKPTTTAT